MLKLRRGVEGIEASKLDLKRFIPILLIGAILLLYLFKIIPLILYASIGSIMLATLSFYYFKEKILNKVHYVKGASISKSIEITPAIDPSFRHDREASISKSIVKNDTEAGLRYIISEPELTDDENIAFTKIKDILVNELTVDPNSLSENEAVNFLKSKVHDIVLKYSINVNETTLDKFYYYLVRDYIKMGKIEALLHDHMIEDISCDGVGIPVYIWHRVHESIPTNIIFNSEKELNDFVMRLAYKAGKHISIANPIVDASLSDGSRVQITYGNEVTKKGSTFTIRKIRADPLTVTDLIIFNTMSSELAAYLWYMVEKKLTMIVVGGTASGKTTSLNALGTFITRGQKIVSIEDTPEINILHENWIPAISRQGSSSNNSGEITMFDLLKAALRQRPDIIIVGEVRGNEAYALFQAMSTGHGGFSSLHADSIKAALSRLTSAPMNIPKELISSSLDLIILQLKLRIGDKSVRRIIQVTEVGGIDDNNEFILNDVFRWEPSNDTYTYSSKSIAFEKISKRFGESIDTIKHEIEKRKDVLEWMAKNGIRRQKEVYDVITQFYSNQDAFYERMRI